MLASCMPMLTVNYARVTARSMSHMASGIPLANAHLQDRPTGRGHDHARLAGWYPELGCCAMAAGSSVFIQLAAECEEHAGRLS